MDLRTIRERQEEYEALSLSRFASRASNTAGREMPIEPCDVRTDYQRDRDRIIHCKSFRRLKYKTQVFLSPEGDHYRTRLTHTLEVAQIARTIARALKLNEDLTEAIALAHDIGHTPFGHVGEAVLDELLPTGFEHNKESVRIVEKLENGKGLNLTFEVRDGILNHKSDGKPCTLEGSVVSFSDRIAYINHDIDDAIRANVLTVDSLPTRCVDTLGNSHGARINNMVRDIINSSFDKPVVTLSYEYATAMDQLRDFMFDRVYTDSIAKREEGKARHVIEQLFKYYRNNIDKVSDEYKKNIESDGADIVAADYIAGMTDRYAVKAYENMFIPRSWQS